MPPVCISRDALGLSCSHGLLSKVSWQSRSGAHSLCWWMLSIDVLPSSGFGSDFSTDDSQIVSPLKYLARDASLILYVTPNDE